MRLEPFALDGRVVRLEPLALEHADALARVATRDRSTYGYTAVPRDVRSMRTYIETLQRDAASGTALPFAQRRVDDGTLVGCTRFMNITWWAGHELPTEVEIGGTWLSADAQRTAVNTEAKLLLLTQAFDAWGVARVAICTDARNERSRRAIERLGASLDGILRNHRPAAGDAVTAGAPRDTAVYSLVPEEWPGVRARLRERLRGG